MWVSSNPSINSKYTFCTIRSVVHHQKHISLTLIGHIYLLLMLLSMGRLCSSMQERLDLNTAAKKINA